MKNKFVHLLVMINFWIELQENLLLLHTITKPQSFSLISGSLVLTLFYFHPVPPIFSVHSVELLQRLENAL